MPLSNAQYDEIMHEYDERQLHNRHILETRRAEVLKKLPRLKEIDASVASSSVRQARLHLDGDTNALASLKQELSALSLERQQLLTASGYPADYLDPVYFYNEAAKGKMFPEGAMLDVRIIAYYEIPKSTSKKKRREMLEHRIRPTKKPDWDNIGKIVCDSLNLVAYHDDSAVVDAQVRKFYSETPKVDVLIKVVGPDQI